MAASGRAPEATAYLGELYSPGLDEPAAWTAMRRLVAEAAAPGQAGWIDVLACAFVPREQALLVLVRAGSDEDVAEIGRRAGITFDRIVEAVVLPIAAQRSMGPSRTRRRPSPP